MTVTRSPIQVMDTAALKLQPVTTDVLVLTVCDAVIGDDRGGLYRWDPASSAAEDLVYMNVIASSLSSAGRWVRFSTRVRPLPQGMLLNFFGVKTLIASGAVTSGACTFNLTLDNTPTGEAIFKEIMDNRAYGKNTATTVAGAIVPYLRSVSSDLKQTVHGFAKANNVVVNLLGALVTPLADADNNTPVGITVQGR